MKIWFLCFIFAIHSLSALTLKDKFLEAEEGTYIITEQNHLISLLHLHTKEENRLLFEEISIPEHLAKKVAWDEWVTQGAPGHTSWILYEVDLNKECVTECYSRNRKAWVPTSEMEAFLIPLMTLKLSYLSEEKRMQTGPTPKPGTVQNRPWGPPQVIQGKKIKRAEYDVYTSKWPIDQTELSGKPIVLYFDKKRKDFPFPYWIQVRDGAIKFKIRALDSGKGLVSPCSDIPRRTPTFLPAAQKEEGKFHLNLTCPTYFDSLKLYAVDMTEYPRVTHSISYQEMRDGESLTLSIDQDKMDALFTPGHEYLWIISSESPEMAIESPFRTAHQ